MSDEIEKFVLQYKVELSDSIRQLEAVQKSIQDGIAAQKEYDQAQKESQKQQQEISAANKEANRQEREEAKQKAAEEKAAQNQKIQQEKEAQKAKAEQEKQAQKEQSQLERTRKEEQKKQEQEEEAKRKQAEEAQKKKSERIKKIGSELDKLVPGFGSAAEGALKFGTSIKGFAGPALVGAAALAALAYSIKQVNAMRREYNEQRNTAWNTGQSVLNVEQNQRQLTAASNGLLNAAGGRTLMEKIQSQLQKAYTDPNPANEANLRLRMAGTSGYNKAGSGVNDVTSALDQIGQKMRSVSVEQANAIGMTLGLTQNETAAIRGRNDEVQKANQLSAAETQRRLAANQAMESLNESFGSIDESFRQTGNIVAEEFLPVFSKVMSVISDWLSGLPAGLDSAITGFEKFNLAFENFMNDIQDPRKVFSGELSFSKNYKDASAVIEKQHQAAREAAEKQNDAAQSQKSAAANNEKAIKLFAQSVNTMAGVVDEQQAWAAWAGSVGQAGGLKGMGQGLAGTAVSSGGGAGQQYGGYSSPTPGANATSAFNFGNIRSSAGGFRAFDNAGDGMAAQANQLLRYYTGKTTGRKLQTLNDIISTWAPSNENDTSAYIKFMSDKMNVGAGQKIDLTNSDVLGKLMYYQAIYEKGQDKISGIYSLSDFQKAAQRFQGNYSVPVMSSNYQSEGKNDLEHAQTRNTVRLDEIYKSVANYIGGGMSVGQLRNGGAAKSDIQWALQKDLFDSTNRVNQLKMQVASPQLAKNHAQYANELLSAEQHLNALRTFSSTVLNSGFGSAEGPRNITMDRPVYNMTFYGITDPDKAAKAVQGVLNEQTKQINNNNNSGVSH